MGRIWADRMKWQSCKSWWYKGEGERAGGNATTDMNANQLSVNALSWTPTKPNAPSKLRRLFWPDHATLNLRAGLLHLMLVLLIGVGFVVKDPPFYIAFNKMWARPKHLEASLPKELFTPICNGTDYVAEELGVWAWFDCMKGNQSNANERDRSADEFQPYEPTIMEGLGRIKVAWLLLGFEGLTSGVHFWMYALDRWWEKLYTRRLNQQLQPWRWFEYSITASIMMLCALSLSRVQDQFLLLSLFLNSFYLNFVGGGLFEVCAWAARKNRSDGEMRRMLTRLQWTAYVSSWFAYGIAIWTSWDALGAVVQPYRELPTGALWGDLFDVVVWVNVGITATFSIFPLIHLYVFDPLGILSWWHLVQHGRPRSAVEVYLRGEKLYIYGSFVAKTTLVATIGAAAWMRKD